MKYPREGPAAETMRHKLAIWFPKQLPEDHPAAEVILLSLGGPAWMRSGLPGGGGLCIGSASSLLRSASTCIEKTAFLYTLTLHIHLWTTEIVTRLFFPWPKNRLNGLLEQISDRKRQRDARFVKLRLDRIDGLAGDFQPRRELLLRPPSPRPKLGENILHRDRRTTRITCKLKALQPTRLTHSMLTRGKPVSSRKKYPNVPTATMIAVTATDFNS